MFEFLLICMGIYCIYKAAVIAYYSLRINFHFRGNIGIEGAWIETNQGRYYVEGEKYAYTHLRVRVWKEENIGMIRVVHKGSTLQEGWLPSSYIEAFKKEVANYEAFIVDKKLAEKRLKEDNDLIARQKAMRELEVINQNKDHKPRPWWKD